MQHYIGTSGFSFDEWKGAFYPANLPSKKRLEYFASRLPAVEINNTFYRMPKPELFSGWLGQVPDSFRFAIKAPRRITHIGKLRSQEDTVNNLLSVCATLQNKWGPILFQLPPTFQKDVGCLREFLTLVKGHRAAFEFRHPTWFDDEVYATLQDADAALVSGDPDDGPESLPLVPTAGFGYLRLRADTYDEAALDSWAARISAQPWTDSFVFLKHEVLGPKFAAELLTRLRS